LSQNKKKKKNPSKEGESDRQPYGLNPKYVKKKKKMLVATLRWGREQGPGERKRKA
jgi:hypothetical protein